MKNLSKLNAGDSASWHDDPWVSHGVRYTSADWTLTYEMRGTAQLSLAAVADFDGWRTSISTADSASLVAGPYSWASYLSRAGERVTTAHGALVVVADLAAVTGSIDSRSPSAKALADCEAALATFTSSGGKVKSYTIGTRQTEFHSLTELMALRGFWQRRVNSEQRINRQLLVRFH
jgi:hypothetical protein